MTRYAILSIFVVFSFMLDAAIADDPILPLLVLTDIENEPDDAMSLVRYLTCANDFDVEGLVAKTFRLRGVPGIKHLNFLWRL